jgi:folate-binding protein YgfZ
MKSPLHEIFAVDGASFIEVGDRLVADTVTRWEEEYRAARDAAIVADRSYRGLLEVSGRDSAPFLHNMLTNDIKSLGPDDGVHAALLTRKGKLISDMLVYRLRDSLLLEMEPERLGPVQEMLSRYIVSEDVEIEDVSGREAIVTVAGPLSTRLLSDLTGLSLTKSRPFQSISGRVESLPITIVVARHGPGPGFDVHVEVDRAPIFVDSLLEIGRGRGLRLAGFQTMNTRRIEAGIPLFGTDMDESHFPLEAGLHSAVSFNKGCYIGQEYVARLAHRGHLNRKLVGLELDAPHVPSPKDEVVGDDGPMGHVTSATDSPALGHPVALGYVHRDYFEAGTTVAVRGKRGDSAAKVVELPFLDES